MERLHDVKKKGLSLLLSLAVVFGLMPGMSLPAYAADNGWTSVTTEDGVTTYLQDFSGSDVPADWVPFYKQPANSTVSIVNGALTLVNTAAGHAKICSSAADLSGAVSVEVKYSYKYITDNPEFYSFIVRNDISGANYSNIDSSPYYKRGLGLHVWAPSQYKLKEYKITDSAVLSNLSTNDRICLPLFGNGGGNQTQIDYLEIIVTRVPDVSSITLDATTTVGVGATKTLAATVSPANADQTVVWSSDDENIVTVDENGVITGVKAGTTTITAKATNGTSDESDDKTATCQVTVQKPIVASAENVSTTYDGEAHGITVNVTDPQSGAAIAFGKTEGTYDLSSSPTITNVENSPLTVYYKITADGYAEKTGSATVTLSKKAAPTPTDEQKPKAIDGLKYTGDPQKLVTAPQSTPTGYEVQYSLDGTTWSTELPKGTKAEKYTVKVKYVGDSNHEDFNGTDIPVTIGKAAAPTPTDEQKPKAKDGLKFTGDPQELVTAPAQLPTGYEKVQYSIDGGKTWTDSISAETNTGEYTVKVKYVGDSNHESFVGDDITAKIGKKDPPTELADNQKPKAIDGLKYTGDPQELVTAPAELPAGYEKVQYSIDDGKTWTDSISTGTDTDEYTVKVKYVGDSNHETFVGEAITAEIGKKDPPAELTDNQKPKAVDGLKYTGDPQELVTAPAELPAGYEKVQYSIDGGETWIDGIPEKTDTDEYTVKVKYVGDSNHETFVGEDITAEIGKKDPPAELTDDQNPKAVDGLKYTGEPQDLVTAPAELPAGYEKVQYSIDNGETWSDEIPTGTKAGEYSVKVKYVGDNNHADFIGDDISVGIEVLTDERRPTAKEDLVYNGSRQQLFNAPKEDIPAPYTMKYAVTTEDKEPDDESLYNTSIPEGTDAGTYYVWYKVVGDENHNGVAAKCVIVAIAHKITEVAEVPATCEKTGVEKHWKDEKGTLYKDAEGKKVTTEAELKIPAAGHNWDKGKVTKAATCTEKGVKTYTCTACKATKNEDIAATGHIYGAWTKLDANQHQRVCEHDKNHVEKANHSWDAGKITKKATTKAEGVKTYTCTVCKATKTETIPKLKPEKKASTVKPVLVAKGIAKGKKAVNLSWNKVSGADKYEIYMSKCDFKGKKYTMKRIKTVNGKTFKWTRKGLKKNTAYKFYVKALKKSGKNYKMISKSKTAHFLTGNVRGKYTNPKSLKLKKSKMTLKKGKSATIKGTVTKVKKSKKLATGHAAKLRFASNNPAVATVNAKGKVTAKKAGTATIYVQTINGIWKTCKVTVK